MLTPLRPLSKFHGRLLLVLAQLLQEPGIYPVLFHLLSVQSAAYAFERPHHEAARAAWNIGHLRTGGAVADDTMHPLYPVVEPAHAAVAVGYSVAAGGVSQLLC